MAGGRRGPSPLPTALKIAHGERHRDRLNPAEPIPRDTRPQCPDDVSDPVREIWDETVEELEVMRIAHSADRHSLRCYCEAVVLHQHASRVLAKSSPLIRGQKGNWVMNPMVRVQRDAASDVQKFAAEFGLTPSARTRIQAKDNSDEQAANPFAATG